MLNSKFFRIFGRFFYIAVILTRQGARYFRLRFLVGPLKKNRLANEKSGFNGPEFVRVTLERLGPTFVKFGQFMSIRPDLVSAEVRSELTSLQDKVPPFPVDEVMALLDTELITAHTEIFSEFEDVPVASASVAQVHRARLMTGEEVAVKMQRPGIKKQMEADIMIMEIVAYLTERLVPRLRKNRPKMLVDEFSKWTERELDFRQEAKNAAHFNFHFKDDPGVKFPAVYMEHSTERILVMEFIKGRKLLDAPDERLDKHSVSRRIAESMLKQIFQDGFFHGDPHPGNIYVLKGEVIAYLDFGIVGYLSRELREWSFDCLYGMAVGDINRVVDSFLELCNANEDDIDRRAYRRHINEVLCDLHVCQICQIPFSPILERFLNTSLEFGLRVPDDVVIMSKAIATMEGTLQTFAPEVNIIDLLKPYAEKYLIIEPDLENALEKLARGPYEVGRLGRLISKRVNRVIERFERGSIRLESDEFKNMMREMDKSSVNISYGVIISALIIFAAVLSNDTAFEQWLSSVLGLPDIPVLPITSLALAAFLSLRLYLRNRTRNQRP